MQRDQVLVAEMIDAAERIVELTAGRTTAEIDPDRDRRDALLWNFTVLGEAAGLVSDETKAARDDVAWTRSGSGTGSCTATGRSASPCSSTPHGKICRA